MKSWDVQFEKLLLSARDYRAFIKMFFERTPEIGSPRALTFGQFAERSGFASKSFMHDVLAGKKRLTPASFDRVSLGLGLNKSWSDYLKTLVALEELSFRNPKHDLDHYARQLERLNSKLRKRTSRRNVSNTDKEKIDVLLGTDVAHVYASLGDTQEGENFDSIVSRSRLAPETVRTVLEQLVRVKVIDKDGNDRYRPGANALGLSELSNLTQFADDFANASERALKRFQSQSKSPEALYMIQTVSVKSDEMPNFKARLAQLIEEFTGEVEEPRGDAVAEICISFTSNHLSK